MKRSSTEISEKLLYTSPPKVTEVAVLFGARSISGTIAREAARLYEAGAFEEIVITGGKPVRELDVLTLLSIQFAKLKRPHLSFSTLEDFTTKETEADYMYRLLRTAEVPDSAITFKDNLSTNAGENVENIKSFLSDHFESATLITIPYEQRRVVGTMRMHPELDHVKLVNHPAYPFGFTPENWSATLIRSLVKLEYDRLDPESHKSYLNKYCMDPDIEAEIEYASDLPDLKIP